MTFAPKGTIKWFNTEKGYGFVSQETGKDLFVHITSFEDQSIQINEGDSIQFEVGQGRQGPMAKDCKIIGREGVPDKGGKISTSSSGSDSSSSSSDSSSDSDSKKKN